MWYKQGTMQSHLVSCEKGCRCLAKTGEIVNMSGKERQRTSRYCRQQYIGQKDIQCLVEETPRSISTEDCENCQKYRSKYIQFSISINGIENQQITTEPEGICRWVRIRPCSSEFEDRTYLGIFLGTLPIGISTAYNEDTGKLTNHTVCNPAILVPDLKKLFTEWKAGGISSKRRKN